MIHFREPRQQVRLIAQLSWGDGWRRIAITNVTTTGLRCECPDAPQVGTPVEIRYQGFSIIGFVQWCELGEFGVICEDMVDVEMLLADSPEVDIGRRVLPRQEVRLPAQFIIADRTAPVVIHDISPSGARLSMKSPPRSGVQGVIQWDGNECACTVAWSGESSLGVIFGDELSAEPQSAVKQEDTGSLPSDAAEPEAEADSPAAAAGKECEDRRGKGRIAVSWTCDVHHADSPWFRVQLSNISTSGCVIGCFAGCQEDMPLYIKLPQLSTIKANVVWKDDYKIVCSFSEPLDPFVLEHLLTERFA